MPAYSPSPACPHQAFSDVFPHLVTATNVPKLVKIDDVNFGDVDAVFCCLPHATTQVRARHERGCLPTATPSAAASGRGRGRS